MKRMSSQQITPSQIARDKQTLRAKMRATRQQLCPHDRVAQNQLIIKNITHLMGTTPFENAGLYLATQYEVNLDALIEEWHMTGKAIYLPHLDDAQTPFHQFQSWQELEIGALDLRQPALSSPVIAAAELDIIILPGLAFDSYGHRLGHGGGWYDRQLADAANGIKSPQLCIGVCYEEQFVDAVPHASFDVRMNIVVTPTAIWKDGRRHE